MKKLSALIPLGVVILVSLSHASDYDDYYGNSQQFNSFGGGSHSMIQSNNGNNIVISRRMGPNQEEEDYISVSTPNIRIDGEYFSCSGLICPKYSFKCVVTSETLIDERSRMKTIAECMDKNGSVLDRKEFTEKNPFPNIEPPFSRYTSVDRDGVISTEDSNGQSNFNSKKMTKEEQAEMLRKVDEETRRINIQIQNQQQQFQAQMEQFQENMQRTFGNNFPFGNTGFPYAQNFPFYNPVYNYPHYPSYPSDGSKAQTHYNPYPYRYNAQPQAHSPSARNNQYDYYNYNDVNNDNV